VLGIVGLGNIGLATARRAQALGMRVIGYDPYLPSWIARDNRIEMVDALLDLARDSDFVSILIPLSAETRALIDETFFVEMKPSAYIINTCRGPVVEESDLIQALREGEIAGAGLDVFEEEPLSLDNPLLEMDNVILTPHMGGASFMSIGEGLCRLGEEAARVLAGTLPMSLVNPEVLAHISVRPRATRG
jgi:D-3-phosphoglycerate dehydrogenase